MKTITLVMIVKNESKVIERCLNSVKDYIDHWVICDTGSTDGTQDIIQNYFKEFKIPGKLYNHKWVNFGFNRSLAISLAQNKSDYSLLLDADFIFNIHDKNFKKTLNDDAYMIKYDGNVDYRQTLFVKSKYDWKYTGVTHEYLSCPDAKIYGNLNSFTIDHKCDGGSRSDKFERDIELLKKGLITEPTNARYMFYLAQSYKDISDYTNAIKYYEMRVEQKNWVEEVYFSLFQIGYCKMMRKDSFIDISDAYLKAYNYRPGRLEALYHLIEYCRLNNMCDMGFKYGIIAIETPYPKDVLFINKPVHEWMFLNEVALCANNINKPEISIVLYDKFLDKNYNLLNNEESLRKNYIFFQKNVEILNDKKNKENKEENINKVAIIIINNGESNIIENLSKSDDHDIILIDNGIDSEKDSGKDSINYSIRIKRKIETISAWNMGLEYVDNLEKINNQKYFAYCFVSTSNVIDKDIVSKMIKTLKEDTNIVGVHPGNKKMNKEEVFFIKNIFSCYRATWFNNVGRFQKNEKDTWGVDIELGIFAFINKKKLIIDHSLEMEHPDGMDIEQKNYVNTLFEAKYGNLYKEIYNKIFPSPKISLENNISLEKGLTFLIRAKNEENIIIKCLSTLVEETKDLKDIEIIVINNKSTDKTNELVTEFIKDKNIKLYQYDYDVCKMGNNIVSDELKTISTYYNWCLDKATKYNVVKWDADFVVNKGELKNMIIEHNLNIRDDHFSIWFTGQSLFLHNGTYLKKVNSNYDSYKIFSKKNGFQWEDYSNLCEYVNLSDIPIKLKYNNPVFYEIFDTSVNEFQHKKTTIDDRDKVDMNIYAELSRDSIYNTNNTSQLEKCDFNLQLNKKTYLVVYYGYHLNSGGTYVTLKTYVDYFKSKGDNVYVFERIPCDDEINKLKPDCIISAQFANADINHKIKEWNIPHVVLTFAPYQYVFNGDTSKYPSLVTYSNSYIKSKDSLQKNGYIVRDPINHTIYEIPKENMNPTYITLIGSPPNIKGHSIFIELAKKFPDLKFMLVTHSDEYKNIVLPVNILQIDYIKDIQELKNKVYSKTKVLLLPSTQEAFGRVTIEATASSIPCIISDYPGLSDATFQMSNYIKEYQDINKWEQELKRVLENYEEEVQKATNLKLKLNFEKDVDHFRNLVLEMIEKHELN